MAPVFETLLRRAASVVEPTATRGVGDSIRRPLEEATRLLARKETSTHTTDPGQGVLDPHDISNVGFFVLFALLGLGFVLSSIWFFFWARNGGFHFKSTDWEDYKTAVLRRRGPNGTLLSGATESTDLGGGSVYKDVVDEDGKTVVTESTGLSGITAGASDIAAREKREEKRAQKHREREHRKQEKKRKGKKHDDEKEGSVMMEKQEASNARRVGQDGAVLDEVAEKRAQDELRNYRHEKAARVGGPNKQSEGSSWDGSNATASHTGTESELLSHRQATPTSTPPSAAKRGGIRKVYSTADRNADRETERIRAKARELRDQGRAARRDFSYQRAEPTDSLLEGSAVSGSTLDESGDLGTKSYHHPRPEIARNRADREREREERRARRGGYRRGRGGEDELD